MVRKTVIWPHEVAYPNQGKPAVYVKLSFLFVKGHLITMKGEEGVNKDKMATHREELRKDSELYVWQNVRAYHSVWLNHIEQGRAWWREKRIQAVLLSGPHLAHALPHKERY